ncbi:MAG: glycosyltransferase family 4 protein [Goleter apudmare HA4340-LM2]|jgi:glycosyltransferase involved in cell wall biosynthesis|nr:glycosyltransferase family 4 protein [Goleter apudmare HA4340-LM2]
MNAKYEALSITSQFLGHRTYGQLLRDYFKNTNLPGSVDFHWFMDECKNLQWLLTRPFYRKLPNSWLQQRNLDFQYFRSELISAYITKSLLRRKLSQKSYTVMHLHTQVMAFLALEYMKIIPTVVSIDYTAALKAQEIIDNRFQWTYQPNIVMEQKVFLAASRIISWSELAKKSVVEDYGISADKVIVIPPGVNLNALKYDENSIKKNDDTCNILFIGGDFIRKGGEDLLSVFLENFADVATLHVVTNKPINCHHHRVRIYHNIKAYTPEWKRLYQQADMFVMPTYSEGLPQVFMEAMAAGLPIISTNLPQMQEVVSDSITGFLVPPGNRDQLANKLKTLINHPTLRTEMGMKGKHIAQLKFDAHKNCSQIENIFHELSVV